MKLTWNEPKISIENFKPNEYVAACYTLVCAIPGTSPDIINDGTKPRYFTDKYTVGLGSNKQGSRTWGDLGIINADDQAHGSCGLTSTSYDASNNVGYEHDYDGSKKNAMISNLTLGEDATNVNPNYIYASWQSEFDNNGVIYTHYGYAIKDNRPNHS